MSRHILLSRVDIRQAHDRVTGALTLRYVGRKLRVSERMFGYPDGTFFAVVLSELPLPETVTTLAAAVGVALDDFPLTNELRRAVADVLAAEAMIEAPDYLNMISEPRTVWLEPDHRELERRVLAAETHVREVTKLLESALRQRMPRAPQILPPVRTYAPVAPASYLGSREEPYVPVPPPEAIEDETEEEVADGPVEISEATGRSVMTAVKTAREQELAQRLPGGARRALARQPAGLYLSYGDTLARKLDICSAMVEGAESGKRSGESTIIDWDGEWPVVARRYGSHGRIVYRVEDALRRSGISVAEGEAA